VYDLLAAEMPEEPTRLLVLPYFEPSGPPGYVADAAGAILGLRTGTTRGEILKAIMECVSMYFVDSLAALHRSGLEASEFVATGGGAKSDAWLQIEADVLGVRFVRPRITEASALGAAMLAGIGTGVFTSAQDCVARFVERVRVFEPDPARHRLYQEKAILYQQLLPSLHGLLSDL
jgi:xylulokinase